MILFLDASALVKRYVEEKDSQFVRTHLAAGPCAASRLSEVEVASALCRRHREGYLKRSQRDIGLEALRADCEDLFLVELSSLVTARATELLTRHNLRAADALQLASCLELRQELRSPDVPFLAFDERLCEAAKREGLPVIGYD